MKTKSSSLKLIVLTVSFALIIPLLLINVLAQKQKKQANPEQKNPAVKISYKNYIWIEGENSVDTNFSKEKTYNFFCSDRFALQLSKDADPASDKGYYATYVFYVSGTKAFDFWMGCTPPGSKNADKPGYASPFDWKIDSSDFKNASSENTFVKEYYAIGGYYWTKISTGILTAGKHTLTIRVNQKRSSGWDYFFYIDAIVFIPAYSDYLMPLMSFPEVASKNFSDKGKSILFEDIDYYKQQIRQKPNDREMVFSLLQVYTWLYEYEKSMDLCREYLKKNPKDIEIRLLLASSLAWADRLDEAIKEYNNIIAIDKNNITARKLLAVLAGWNNRYDESIKNYREIVEIDRMNIDAYISLATQYSWKNEPTKAFEIFKKAESIAPKNIEVLYALGDNYFWIGKTFEASQQYKKIISIDEKQIEAYKKLAKLYLSMDRKESADDIMDEASRVVNIYPELAGFSLDITSELNKDTVATLGEYRKALEKNPDDIETRKNLIDSYIWNKMDAEAAKEYNNLLNVKIVKGIEKTDERIANLAIESVKLRQAAPVLAGIKEKLAEIAERYKKAESYISGGKDLPEGLNENKIKNDLLLTLSLVKKVDLFEQNLSYFNDVISYYDRDIQSYLTQKNALKWEPDKKRIETQADESEKMFPQDYRPKKVTGLLEYLYGSLSVSKSKFDFVYKVQPEKSFPVYVLAASELSDHSATGNLIADMQKNKNFKAYTENLKKLQDFLKALQAEPAPENKMVDIKSMASEISKQSQNALSRLEELISEKKEKLKTAKKTMQYMYEKMFLDTEIDNVNIYNEIANYNLNKGNQKDVLDYYGRILAVQPLNVEINYKTGAQNQALGYWKSAMGNYELCINNDPDNQNARAAHYDLQKEHSPALKNEFSYFSDQYDKGQDYKSTRINNLLMFTYPLNNWLALNAGYGFRKVSDTGGTAIPGKALSLTEGSFTRNTAIAGTDINFVPLGVKLFLDFKGHSYKGKISHENKLPTGDPDYIDMATKYNSDISYSSINYSAGIDFLKLVKGLQLRFIYAFDDEADLTLSLKTKLGSAITSKSIQGIVNLSFSEYSFPLSDRLSLSDTIKYSMLSDSNTRTSTYNQLTFTTLKIPSYGIDLNMNAIGAYDASKFTEYSGTERIKHNNVSSLPYWAPDKIYTYGGGVSFKQSIENFLKGKFSYELYFNCTKDYVKGNQTKVVEDQFITDENNYDQTNYTPGIRLTHAWDKIDYYINYSYAYSKSNLENAKPYTSQSVEFGLQGKFYTVYSPTGAGAKSIAMATASPTMITPDGDGKDDYAIFSLTGFDEKGITSWELEIFSNSGEKVKSITGQGTPPASVKWDGTDKANSPLPEAVYYYQITIVNSAGERNSSKKETVFVSRKAKAIAPELSYTAFSPNGDNTKDTVSVEFKATDREHVSSWTLYVMDRPKTYKPEKDRERRVVRTIKGYEFLPSSVEWDGKDNNGKVLPDGDYHIFINVKYNDEKDITSPDIKATIITKAQIRISTNTETIIPAKTMLRIIPESSDKDLASWKISFYSIDDKLIKMIQSSGKLPEIIAWNGTDENSNIVCYNMPVSAVMEITDKAGNKGASNKVNLWLGFLEEKQKDFTLITLFDQGIMHKRKDENLTQTGKDVVKRLITELQKYKKSKKIRIIGHTSSDGSTDANLELSKTRARNLGQSIKDGLKIETGVIFINGVGKSQPSKINDRKLDDRYEIEIY
ncbi:MAG: tetratricopeptide repeat protein [Spirochaetota bacterium]